MTYEEIPLPAGLTLAEAARWIEADCAAEDLRVGSRGTLATYPGSIHWHLKRGQEMGTLEVTLLNRERRIHLSVHKNRTAPWTEATLERLASSLTARIMTFSTARPEGGGSRKE